MARSRLVYKENVARDIREGRKKRYTGRGGAKSAPKPFGVSPQQWPHWEKGRRIPDEKHLDAMVAFSGVSVDFLKRDECLVSPSLRDLLYRPPRPSVRSPARQGTGG